MSDDELVEQIRRGNEKAAEELIQRYYTSILRYCKWHCSSSGQAEDLTQETFFRLFKNLFHYQGKNKFKGYLYTIANHVCVDESRKIPLYPIENEPLLHECKEINQMEDQEEIEFLLGKLSSEQREAILLRYSEELSYIEIARIMKCNMRTAQSRVRSALKILRKEIENEV